eukprot:TRINITY_DN7000_c0_g1_i6.p2 TRINITY_DN7000_c0_g1~~TRINITY_DN7000_c0_g1_i6.p2  ORF type:complete len:129 (+),score=34.70 TRINITY_DN7000_c0_g1_i6:98-484(+)
MKFIFFFFFFQAEDGIRDAQESRGLGDVYKRQPPYTWLSRMESRMTYETNEKIPYTLGCVWFRIAYRTADMAPAIEAQTQPCPSTFMLTAELNNQSYGSVRGTVVEAPFQASPVYCAFMASPVTIAAR